ncbi:MAG: PilN domain-containing protein [Thiobacillus sp.]
MSQQINLISPRLLKKRYAFGFREMAMGLGLILVSALVWAGFLHYQASALETQAAQQESRQADAQQDLDRLTAEASRPPSALLADRVKATQAQVAQHEALLGAIGGTIKSTASGFSPQLRALAHSSTEGVWLNGFTLAPGYVALKGSILNADLLTSYMDRLGQQPPFAGLQFSSLTAVRVQPAGDSTTQAEALPGHIDFDLYSGTLENPAEQGRSHGQ